MRIKNSAVRPMFTAMSVFCSGFSGRGAMMALAPRIQKVLMRFDPTTFPTAISVLPLYVATAEAANSGRDVPIEITVSAIRLSERPILLAISMAPFTIH